MEATPITPAAQALPAILPIWQRTEPCLFGAHHARAKADVHAIHAKASAYTAERGGCYDEQAANYAAALERGLRERIDGLHRELDTLREQFRAPGSTLSAEFDGVVFEVAGEYFPEERGDLEEPGCSAYFEASAVYLNGAEVGPLLDRKVFDALEADCLRQCQQNRRNARAARRFPDLAGEAL